jgi:CheY-like chemotaxis protein
MTGGETTVLIVDDEPDIRLLVRIILESADSEVRIVAEAIDGTDALGAYDKLTPPPVPDVVVLDNRMPHMSGLDVARQLLTKVPGQRIVLFSAHLDERTAEEAASIGIGAVLAKDDISQLPDVIRGLLAS